MRTYTTVATYRVAPFLQDRATFYTVGLPDPTVRALAITDGWLWAGTPKGLARAPIDNPSRWEPLHDKPVRWLVPDCNGTVYWATEQQVAHLQKGILWEGEKIVGIAPARSGGLWIGCADALHYWNGTILRTLPVPAQRTLHWYLEDARGRLYIFAEGELERHLYQWNPEAEAWRIVGIRDPRGRYYDDIWFTAVSDPLGHLWIGTRTGILLGDGEGWWLPREGQDGGPPYGRVHVLCLAPNGDLWAGTPEGACRLREGRWSYFWGKRWLPDNRVHAIAVDSQNRAWIATAGGIACIESGQMTLSQKAEHYERLIALRHNRNGFVFNCIWDDPTKPDEWKIEASDNDGLWTALYCAAQCFQYAVTKDPASRERARQSMQALLKLESLTGIPGFPARSLIHQSETRVLRSHGEWHASPVDPNYIWKGDTSSDELDGHYFIWAIYYDLVADESERTEIDGVVRRVTDHLIANHWRLIDKDGKPTRWAIFHPEALNDDPLWEAERGLNALSILSHLKVAYHITDDLKYQHAYESLIQNHHYLINAITQKQLPPFDINHSDDELAFLCYYPLLLYEQDPVYRRMWLMSLERSWQIERPERNPLFNFIYGAVTGRPCDVEQAVQTLQEWPLDLRNWECRNSHRTDITLDVDKGRFEEWQSVEVIPYSERTVMRWNGNPYRLDGGDPLGRTEEDGSAFLLAYWMGRYHRLIEE